MNAWLTKAVFCAEVKITSNDWKTQWRHRNLVWLSPCNILQQFPFICMTKQGQRSTYFSKGSVIFAKFLWKRKAWMSCVSILGGRSPCNPSICRSCNVKAIPWKQERWEIISSSSSNISIYNVILFAVSDYPLHPFLTAGARADRVWMYLSLLYLFSSSVGGILFDHSFSASLESSCPLSDFVFLCETGEQLRDLTAGRLRFKSKVTTASWIVSQERIGLTRNMLVTQSGLYNHRQ